MDYNFNTFSLSNRIILTKSFFSMVYYIKWTTISIHSPWVTVSFWLKVSSAWSTTSNIWVLFMPISIKLVKCVQIHLVLCNNRISNLFDLNEFSNEENHIRVLFKNSFLWHVQSYDNMNYAYHQNVPGKNNKWNSRFAYNVFEIRWSHAGRNRGIRKMVRKFRRKGKEM